MRNPRRAFDNERDVSVRDRACISGSDTHESNMFISVSPRFPSLSAAAGLALPPLRRTCSVGERSSDNRGDLSRRARGGISTQCVGLAVRKLLETLYERRRPRQHRSGIFVLTLSSDDARSLSAFEPVGSY